MKYNLKHINKLYFEHLKESKELIKLVKKLLFEEELDYTDMDKLDQFTDNIVVIQIYQTKTE